MEDRRKKKFDLQTFLIWFVPTLIMVIGLIFSGITSAQSANTTSYQKDLAEMKAMTATLDNRISEQEKNMAVAKSESDTMKNDIVEIKRDLKTIINLLLKK
jgi:uncharacterized membrane-anchored protein YhcB (DUF1043 family)